MRRPRYPSALLWALLLWAGDGVPPAGAATGYGAPSKQRLKCMALHQVLNSGSKGQAQAGKCDTQVVIVGAGAAGLAAARTLQDNWELHGDCDCTELPNLRRAPTSFAECLSINADACEWDATNDTHPCTLKDGWEHCVPRGSLNVTVVEAQTRVGGRVYTKDAASSWDRPGVTWPPPYTEGAAVEMGAMWVHDGADADNPIIQIIHSLGRSAELHDINGTNVQLMFNATAAVPHWQMRRSLIEHRQILLEAQTRMSPLEFSQTDYTQGVTKCYLTGVGDAYVCGIPNLVSHPANRSDSKGSVLQSIRGVPCQASDSSDIGCNGAMSSAVAAKVSIVGGAAQWNNPVVGTIPPPPPPGGDFDDALAQWWLAADVELPYGAAVSKLDTHWYNFDTFQPVAAAQRGPTCSLTPPAPGAGPCCGQPVLRSIRPHANGGVAAGATNCSAWPPDNVPPGSGPCLSSACTYTGPVSTDKAFAGGYLTVLKALQTGDVGMEWTDGALFQKRDPKEVWPSITPAKYAGQWTIPKRDANYSEVKRTAVHITVDTGREVTHVTRRCNDPDSSTCANDDSTVTVTTTDGTVYSADVVIMAVPLGVLKAGSITFDPPLPREKSTAIEQAGFGNLNKLVLYYDASDCATPCQYLPFSGWIPSTDQVKFYGVARGGTNSFSRGLFTYWVDFTSVVSTASVTRPMLVGFASADSANLAEQLTDDIVLMAANLSLTRIFGSFGAPAALQRHQWGTDPYARGSYSYWANGNTHAVWAEVARPVEDWLYFTGEHSPACVDFAGWVWRPPAPVDAPLTCADIFSLGLCDPGQGLTSTGRTFHDLNGKTTPSDATPQMACCACGGGRRRFPSGGRATVHGAMRAGREAAIEVISARDKAVTPEVSACSDAEGPLATQLFRVMAAGNMFGTNPEVVWEDMRTPCQAAIWHQGCVDGELVVGGLDPNRTCDFYRRYPMFCQDGSPGNVYGKSARQPPPPYDPANWKFAELTQDIANLCPQACGNCRPGVAGTTPCDSFPCLNGGTCVDSSDGLTFKCDCGDTGYAGTTCDEDYHECYYEPCGNGLCYDSHSVASAETLPEFRGIGIAQFKCECQGGYVLDGTQYTLENGVSADTCQTCEFWYTPQCSDFVVPGAAAFVILFVVYCAYQKTMNKEA
jgi:hypothetical protein